MGKNEIFYKKVFSHYRNQEDGYDAAKKFLAEVMEDASVNQFEKDCAERSFNKIFNKFGVNVDEISALKGEPTKQLSVTWKMIMDNPKDRPTQYTLKTVDGLLKDIEKKDVVVFLGSGVSGTQLFQVPKAHYIGLNTSAWRLNVNHFFHNVLIESAHLVNILDFMHYSGYECENIYYIPSWIRGEWRLPGDGATWTIVFTLNWLLSNTNMKVILTGFDLDGYYSSQKRQFVRIFEKFPNRIFRVGEYSNFPELPFWEGEYKEIKMMKNVFYYNEVFKGIKKQYGASAEEKAKEYMKELERERLSATEYNVVNAAFKKAFAGVQEVAYVPPPPEPPAEKEKSAVEIIMIDKKKRGRPNGKK